MNAQQIATEKQIKFIRRLLNEQRRYIQHTYANSSELTMKRQMDEAAHSIKFFEMAEVADDISKADASKLINSLQHIAIYESAISKLQRDGVIHLLGANAVKFANFLLDAVASGRKFETPAQAIAEFDGMNTVKADDASPIVKYLRSVTWMR